MSNVWFILCCRITDEVVVACKLLNGHLYKGKEIGREQMVIMHLCTLRMRKRQGADKEHSYNFCIDFTPSNSPVRVD